MTSLLEISGVQYVYFMPPSKRSEFPGGSDLKLVGKSTIPTETHFFDGLFIGRAAIQVNR